MLKKKYWLTALLLSMVLTVASGCGSSGKPAKEALQEAMNKAMTMESYTFKGSFGIDELSLPAEALGSNPAAGMVPLLKGASITASGAYQSEPLRMEATAGLSLEGDLKMSLEVPILLEGKKMWVKIPQIPMVPLPETLTEKFVEVDLEKLAEESGQDLTSALDITVQQQLGQELSAVLVKDFDEKTYFSELKKDEAGLPEDVKADRIIKFAVTKDNSDEALNTLFSNTLPQILDILMSKEEYMKAVDLSKEELEQAKTELAANKDEALAEIKKVLTVNDLTLVTAIQDGYAVYQNAKIDIGITDPDSGESMKLALHFNTQYGDINKKVEFKQEIPTDAIPVDKLAEELGTGAELGY